MDSKRFAGLLAAPRLGIGSRVIIRIILQFSKGDNRARDRLGLWCGPDGLRLAAGVGAVCRRAVKLLVRGTGESV